MKMGGSKGGSNFGGHLLAVSGGEIGIELADIFRSRRVVEMEVANTSTADCATIQMGTYNGLPKQRFRFVKNSDGTYTIKTDASQYTKCLDGQPGAYATDASTDVPIQQCTADSTKASQRWYLVTCKDDATDGLHMSSTMGYSADGNQVTEVIDNHGGITEYEYNEYDQMAAVISPNLYMVDDKDYYKTNYTYDTLDRVIGIQQDVIGFDSDAHTPRGWVQIGYTYSSDRLSKIDTNTADYFFTYDQYGRQTMIYVGQVGSYGSADVKRALVTNTYDSRDNLIQQTYGTNLSSPRTFTYDALDRLISTGYTGSVWERYAYNAMGQLGLYQDLHANSTTRYTYDLSGRLIQSRQVVGGGLENGKNKLQLNYTYEDKTNRLQSMTAIVPMDNSYSQHAHITTAYVYGSGLQADRVMGVKFSAAEGGTPTQRLAYTYDALGRRTQSTLKLASDLVTTYTYGDSSTYARTRIKTLTNGSDVWRYDYDDEGNIISISLNGSYQHMYNYDSLGQLIEDWDFATESVICYTYDTGGNITKKETYANWNKNSTPTTVNYTYGDSTWKDLLTNYNGTSISYDSIGNPANWRDSMTFVWSGAGRELSSVSVNGTRLGSYGYDSAGIRRTKYVGGVSTIYYVQDGVCYGESRSDGVSLQYLRDETGKVIGYRYQNDSDGLSDMCYFVFNAQGDVIQVVDQLGTVMANYTYDTWGKLISATNGSGNTIGTGNSAYYNPFLYRGYYYDYETGFYYLQSRYYDPVVGRFLNADGQLNTNSLIGYNMFAYCENNPVIMTDPFGDCCGYETIVAPGGVNDISSPLAYCILRQEHMQMASQLPHAMAQKLLETTLDEFIIAGLAEGANATVRAVTIAATEGHFYEYWKEGPYATYTSNTGVKYMHTIKQGKSKIASKTLNWLAFGYDICKDACRYGPKGKFGEAALITIGQYGLSLLGGILISKVTTSAFVIFLGGVAIGSAVAYGAETLKEHIL